MPTLLRTSLLGTLMGLVCTWATDSIARGPSYAVAARQYQREQWEAAATSFAAVLQSEAEKEFHLEAEFYLAECRMQLGQYALARDGYLRVLEQSDSHHEVRTLFRLGEATLLAGDVASGRELLQQSLKQYPRDPSAAFALCHLGELSHEAGDFDSAIVFFQRVLDNHPNSPKVCSARLGLAKALLAAEKPEQVAGIVGRPDDFPDAALAAQASLLIGRAFYDLGKYDEASQQFQQTFEDYPQTVAACRSRIAAAWVLWREEKFAEIAAIVEPLADEPQWLADYHYLTGMAAYGQEEWADGAKHLAKAVSLRADHPSRDAMLFYQGVCYLRLDRQDVARHLFERLCADYPGSKWSSEAASELDCMVPADRVDVANQEPTNILRSTAASSGIASFYDEQPSQNSVRANSQNAVKARELLDEAVGLQRDGRYDSAIAAYTELINLETTSPTRSEGLWRNAKLHFQLKRFEQAVLLCEQFLQEQPASQHAAEAIADLGWLHVSLAEGSAARDRFKELLEKFPQSPQVAEAAYWLAGQAADENDSEMAGRNLRLVVESLGEVENESARQQELFARAVSLRCKLAADNQDWQTIEEIVRQSLPGLPDGADRVRLEYWEAEAAFRTRQYSDAREKFANLDAKTFGIQETWVAVVSLRRAQLAARRQQWREVLKCVDRIEREYPDFPLKYEADYLRGRAEAGLGNFSAAREAYHEVIENEEAGSTETSVAAQWMIGETYFHQSNYELARVAYRAVIDREAPATWQARAALQLGKCWELEEHWDAARAMYSEALERWPTAEPREMIEARLKWAESRSRVRR